MKRVLGSWIPGEPPPQRWRPSLVPAFCVQMKIVWWWCCRRLGNKDLSKIMEIEIEKRTSANLENKLTLVVGKRHQFLPPLHSTAAGGDYRHPSQAVCPHLCRHELRAAPVASCSRCTYIDRSESSTAASLSFPLLLLLSPRLPVHTDL